MEYIHPTALVSDITSWISKTGMKKKRHLNPAMLNELNHSFRSPSPAHLRDPRHLDRMQSISILQRPLYFDINDEMNSFEIHDIVNLGGWLHP